jgi:hypothetical protein
MRVADLQLVTAAERAGFQRVAVVPAIVPEADAAVTFNGINAKTTLCLIHISFLLTL